MNIADSFKHVLRNRSQSLFTEFWNEDVKAVLKDSPAELLRMFKSGAGQVKSFKRKAIKSTFSEVYDSTQDMVTIFKVIPARVKEGFSHFKEDLVHELENQADAKHKTIFCLKVLAALGSFSLAAIYNVKRGTGDFAFNGLKRKNAFTQFLVHELVFKLSQVFILRFLSEVEQQVSDPEELSHIRFFKGLIADKEKLQEEAHRLNKELEPGDRAVELVEELKNYIFTGKRA